MKTKNILFALCLLALCPGLGRAQIIETVAGNGGHTYNGDSLAATATAFTPVGMAFNSKGELYFSTYDCRIRKITSSGIVVTVAGIGYDSSYRGNNIPAKLANLSSPSGLAFDKAGNLFVCDAGNNQIRKIDTLGMISLVAGIDTGYGLGGGYNGDSLLPTKTKLNEPKAILVCTDNSIVFSEFGSNRIRKLSSTGTISTIAGTGVMGFYGDGIPATDASLWGPMGLVEDKRGNIIFCDEGSNSLRKINTDGIISTICGNGYAGNTGDDGPASAGQLVDPLDVRIDDVGNMYISNPSAARIRMIDTGMILHTYVGNGYAGYNGDGIPATSAELYLPTMMAMDARFNLYFSDEFNYRIRSVNNTEIINIKNKYTYGIYAYPNPVSNDGVLNVAITGEFSGNADLQLTNQVGIPVETIQLPQDFNGVLHIKLHFHGTYFLTFTEQLNLITIKIIY